MPGLDVLITGFQPGNAAKDIADTVVSSRHADFAAWLKGLTEQT
ncbi:hypothetical protein ACFCXA_22280 [Streptomyces virginiae]